MNKHKYTLGLIEDKRILRRKFWKSLFNRSKREHFKRHMINIDLELNERFRELNKIQFGGIIREMPSWATQKPLFNKSEQDEYRAIKRELNKSLLFFDV